MNIGWWRPSTRKMDRWKARTDEFLELAGGRVPMTLSELDLNKRVRQRR